MQQQFTRQFHKLGKGWRSALAAVVCGLGFLTASHASAQVQCGDIIGPNETIVLQSDVGPCDDDTGGLKVFGPATLDLNGHTIQCVQSSTSAPRGITIVGEKAIVRDGQVADCGQGVLLSGIGKHRLEEVTVLRSERQGIIVTDTHNRVTRNRVVAGLSDGFLVQGNKNTLSENRVEGGLGDGFVVTGEKNKLSANQVERVERFGFVISGTSNQLKKNLAIGNEYGYVINGEKNKFIDNEAVENDADGFEVGDIGAVGIVLLKNTSLRNGSDGFQISGPRHRLVENTARQNDGDGIRVGSFADRVFLTKNIALDNNQDGRPDRFDLADLSPEC